MDKKSTDRPNIIEPIFNKFKSFVVPRLPPFITTYNLTLISLLWSSLILFAGFKSIYNIKWFYLIIICVFFHIITDILDGAVGRFRNTGAIKWGYFMDHTMDIILFNSVFFALFLRLSKYRLLIFIISILITQMLFSSFLTLDINGLDISSCNPFFCIGPGDALIILNLILFYIIQTNGKPAFSIFYIIIFLLIIINFQKIYEKQLKLHKEDMIDKS
jgi:phosphatidylglycerophosphate synthase